MNKRLAELIIEHEKDLYPYLYLRALEVQQNYPNRVLVPIESVSKSDLDLLKMSGFIEYGTPIIGDHEVILKEDGRYLCDPPTLIHYEKKDRQEYIPRLLEKLCKILGYPDDWAINTAKYRTLIFHLTKKQSEGTIVSTAEYAAQNNPDINLNIFLSKQGFKACLHNMQHKKVTKKNKDRCEAAGYKIPRPDPNNLPF